MRELATLEEQKEWEEVYFKINREIVFRERALKRGNINSIIDIPCFYCFSIIQNCVEKCDKLEDFLLLEKSI